MPKRKPPKARFLRVAGHKVKIRLSGQRLGEAQEEALIKIISAGILWGNGCPYYVALDLRGSSRLAGRNYRFALDRLIRANPELFRIGRVGRNGGHGAVYIGEGSKVADWVKESPGLDLHPEKAAPWNAPEEKEAAK